MRSGNLVLDTLGVSPISCSHKAGTPYQDLIRADREFPGVQPISLHTQETPIHERPSPTGCTMTVNRKHLNTLPIILSGKEKKKCSLYTSSSRDSGSPGCLLPLHLLPVHSQQFVQLSEELRWWGAIVLLSQDELYPLS